MCLVLFYEICVSIDESLGQDNEKEDSLQDLI